MAEVTIPEIRIQAAAKELNVSWTHLIETLQAKGFRIESKPTTKITREMYDVLRKEYSQDIADIELSRKEQIKLPANNDLSRKEKIKWFKQQMKLEPVPKSINEVEEPIVKKAEEEIVREEIKEPTILKIEIPIPIAVNAVVTQFPSVIVKSLPSVIEIKYSDAFITRANAKKIVLRLDTTVINIHEEIYKLEFKWFSKREIRQLLSFKLLFSNPDKFFEIYEKSKVIDSKTYVKKETAPAFHSTLECGRLNSNFLNYKIPNAIKARGDEAIEEFRKWFSENEKLMERGIDLFISRMEMKFNFKEKIEIVNYENSGLETFLNIDLETLEEKIDDLIHRANSFYLKTESHKIILDNFGHAAYLGIKHERPNQNKTGYSDDEIWPILKEFQEYFKAPLIKFLREYYRVKFNKELKFKGDLLTQLGFEPCRQCHSFNEVRRYEDLVPPPNDDVIPEVYDELPF